MKFPSRVGRRDRGAHHARRHAARELGEAAEVRRARSPRRGRRAQRALDGSEEAREQLHALAREEREEIDEQRAEDREDRQSSRSPSAWRKRAGCPGPSGTASESVGRTERGGSVAETVFIANSIPVGDRSMASGGKPRPTVPRGPFAGRSAATLRRPEVSMKTSRILGFAVGGRIRSRGDARAERGTDALDRRTEDRLRDGLLARRQPRPLCALTRGGRHPDRRTARRSQRCGRKVPTEEFAAKIASFGQNRARLPPRRWRRSPRTSSWPRKPRRTARRRPTSGLVKRVVKEGSGASPKAEDTVKVHYHGTLRDGSVFDSSVDRKEPVEFPLNRVIPCWTEAVQTMKIGEKAHITCPSDNRVWRSRFPARRSRAVRRSPSTSSCWRS